MFQINTYMHLAAIIIWETGLSWGGIAIIAIPNDKQNQLQEDNTH